MRQVRIMRRDGPSSVETDLHLCNNYRHLLFALASIAAEDKPATVVFLEDEIRLSPDLRRRLAGACPQARFLFTRDQDEIAAFARLPAALPAILRRNLTFGGPLGLRRPHNWQPPFLAGQRFSTGYIYHAGFFLSKAVAGLCSRVVLRESGLNNYVSLTVRWPKALLRLAMGLPPFSQTWGEEPWVDTLEMSNPAILPHVVRAKARKLTFEDVMDGLPPAVARGIAAAFLGRHRPPDLSPRSALLLTQPLSAINICSPAEQHRIYRSIVVRLHDAGYTVYVKPHPLDGMPELPDVCSLPGHFPIEALPYVTDEKFDLVVALCSASLSSGARPVARHSLQLLSPEIFNAQGFSRWPDLIDNAMH